MTLAVELPEDQNTPLSVGTQLGTYVLESVLGEGSMGRVYLARHTRLGREVALKLLHPHLLGDARLVRRMVLEGQVVNQINHENIVEVHDFVDQATPRRVYCVMELLRGETLAQRLARSPPNLESIVSMVRQIADALGAAHAVNVVHRDLKPDNVFLLEREGRDDWVKVLDFGVAKLAPVLGEIPLVESQHGALLGTPQYMAPEQAAGLEVDGRTDVYALGTVLYELLSGAPPFEARAFGQLAADLITRPPPPLPLKTPAGEKIPPALAALALRCLAKQPAERPQSMAEVLDAFEQPVVRRGRRVAVVGSIALIALAALFLIPRDAPSPAIPPSEQAVAAPAPDPVPVPLPTAQLAPPALSLISLRLETLPAGAQVKVDGVVRGRTPLTLSMPRDDARHALRFELVGYQVLERSVVASQSQLLELPLRSSSRPSRPVVNGVLDPY